LFGLGMEKVKEWGVFLLKWFKNVELERSSEAE
jgi:hypothetical protein